MGEGFTFTAPLWRWTARQESADSSSWCFVTLPPDVAEEVRDGSGEPRGFGSVRVRVRVGATTWDTSVFPDSGSGGFVLPVKKAVRAAAGVEEGDELTVTLSLRDPA
ncbi:hypothetical protein CFI00_00480 [Nocardioides sp. S5]|uniref:DUF1905 domain-containing protein n=1 Tax=Nocardioides sp. S5 TaxID=2017486 RepID=UPI001A8C6503|nr:DUF1905 domain-containing protein [Nocardioides sp. S5]QSR29003.1 hypothetical protein CFI00_00480 [Nocardioides sp. S5]